MVLVVDGVEYLTQNYKECFVKSIKTSESNVYIPAQVCGFWVTGVCDNGFAHKEMLISVKLPDTIGEIGFNAFMGCYNLQAVEIWNAEIPTKEKSNTLILKSMAFGECYSLEKLDFSEKQLEIHNRALYMCPNLSKITGNISYVMWSSFEGCDCVQALSFGEYAKLHLNIKTLPCLKHLYFDKSATIPVYLANELANQQIVIHCPQSSEMVDLSYLGCHIETY